MKMADLEPNPGPPQSVTDALPPPAPPFHPVQPKLLKSSNTMPSTKQFQKVVKTDTVDFAVLKSTAPYVGIVQKPPSTMTDLETAAAPSESVDTAPKHPTATPSVRQPHRPKN